LIGMKFDQRSGESGVKGRGGQKRSVMPIGHLHAALACAVVEPMHTYLPSHSIKATAFSADAAVAATSLNNNANNNNRNRGRAGV
jgi:hypothetical protein